MTSSSHRFTSSNRSMVLFIRAPLLRSTARAIPGADKRTLKRSQISHSPLLNCCGASVWHSRHAKDLKPATLGRVPFALCFVQEVQPEGGRLGLIATFAAYAVARTDGARCGAVVRRLNLTADEATWGMSVEGKEHALF